MTDVQAVEPGDEFLAANLRRAADDPAALQPAPTVTKMHGVM